VLTPAAPASGAPRACHVTGDLPRILCIDDIHDIADSTVDLLKLLGYEARACYDGPSALTLVDVFDPHICLIDLSMPGMDGDEVAIRLREVGRPRVLVAVTAMNNEPCCQRIATAGFDLHLVKPVDPRRLSEMIASLWPSNAPNDP
jgi:CheY-like chemotaxis protein